MKNSLYKPPVPVLKRLMKFGFSFVIVKLKADPPWRILREAGKIPTKSGSQ
jgi:hypothetical protein